MWLLLTGTRGGGRQDRQPKGPPIRGVRSGFSISPRSTGADHNSHFQHRGHACGLQDDGTDSRLSVTTVREGSNLTS